MERQPAAGIRGDQVGGIVVVSDRLVAIGGDENGTPLAWSSADGATWTPVRLPAEAGTGATISGIAGINGVAVIVGQALADRQLSRWSDLGRAVDAPRPVTPRRAVPPRPAAKPARPQPRIPAPWVVANLVTDLAVVRALSASFGVGRSQFVRGL